MADQIEFNAMDADFLLNHPILNAAFDAVKANFVGAIEEGPADRATQDGLIIGLQVLKSIKDELHEYITDATMEKHKLEIEEY